MSYWQLNFSNTVGSAEDLTDLRNLSTTAYQGAVLLSDGGSFERINTDLSATMVTSTVTSSSVDSATNTVTSNAHGLIDGNVVISTTAVNGLSLQTLYYITGATTNTFKLASSFDNSRSGTAFDLNNTINFTVKRLKDPLQGVYVVSTGESLIGTDGAWVRKYSEQTNVKWFGAKGDNSAADLASLQAATDFGASVFIPEGTYKINGPWLLDNYATLNFESRESTIKTSDTSSSSAILRARGTTVYRNFYITINGGLLQGPTPGGGVTGIDFVSTTYGLVVGTFISQCGDGIRVGGTGSQGAFYNRFTDLIITDIVVGVRCGTLGNENIFRGVRIGGCVVGTDDNDNTCNTYDACAIEVFSSTGHRVSNDGLTSQRIRYINSRLENVGSVGIGIDIKAAAQSTCIYGEFYTGVATGVQDGGTGTSHLAPY